MSGTREETKCVLWQFLLRFISASDRAQNSFTRDLEGTLSHRWGWEETSPLCFCFCKFLESFQAYTGTKKGSLDYLVFTKYQNNVQYWELTVIHKVTPAQRDHRSYVGNGLLYLEELMKHPASFPLNMFLTVICPADITKKKKKKWNSL